MKKRILSFILVAAMLVTNNGIAWAEPVKDNSEWIESEMIYADPVSIETSAKILKRKVNLQSAEDRSISLKSGNYEKWIDRVNLPDYAMDFYHSLEEAVDGDGLDDYLITGTNGEDNGILVRSVNESATSEDDMNDQINNLFVETSEAIYATCAALDRDHPEVFWLSGTVFVGYSLRYASDFSRYELNIYYLLNGSDGTSVIRPEYVDSSAIYSDIDTVNNCADNITGSASGSDAEKVAQFNEWLTTNNEYNSYVSGGDANSAPKSAWECVSALQGNVGGNGPVCEGYARALKVLCDKSSIPCVLVDGYAKTSSNSYGEAHMWNNVEIDDAWYGVDVTWNDPLVSGVSGAESGYESVEYLLVGSETTNSANMTFADSHPITNRVFANGISFTNGPALSVYAYEMPAEHTHVAGDVVVENELDATCVENGSYDNVVYCLDCGEELSRETVTIDAKGHQWGDSVVIVEPTTTTTGEETATCVVCGETMTTVLDMLVDEKNYIAKGTYGDLDWTIDEDGLLTISGEGDFNVEGCRAIVSLDGSGWTYEGDHDPCYDGWKEYRDSIRSAVVENVTNITSLDMMFYDCQNLERVDLSGLDTSKVTTMGAMFAGCVSLKEINFEGFDTSKVTNMAAAFSGCMQLEALDLSDFDTSNVQSMVGMFFSCQNLKSLDVSGFDTGCVQDMGDMFHDCSSLTSLDVSHFNTSNVTSMYGMFYNCCNLTSLDVSHFNTSSVLNMLNMFGYCNSLESLDVSGFDTSNVQEMGYMFYFCESLTDLDVSGFDTSNAVSMSRMFGCCTQLTRLDVSNFNTSNVENMAYMFGWCYELHDIDLSRFDTSHVTDMTGMFYIAQSINTDFTISGPIDHYNNCFYKAAHNEDCKVNVSYAGKCSDELAYAIWDTKLDDDHVYLLGFEHDHQWDEKYSSAEIVTAEDGKKYNETTYTCTICGDTRSERTQVVGSNDTIQPGETVGISIDEENQMVYLSFTPMNTDAYTFYSTGNRDTYCGLYDSSYNEITGSNDGGNVNNFKIDYVLEAGITYIFGMGLLPDSDVGTFNVTLETLHDWGESEVIQEPTDEEEGIIRHTCTYCGTTKEEACGKILHSGIDGNLNWSIDYRGHLVIEGTGDYSYVNGDVAWCKYNSEIITAEVNVSDITDTSMMFAGCQNLTDVDLSRLDTSNVQRMNSMFFDCINLTSLDVSGFDTSSVQSMSAMFYGCNNLMSLDVSKFDTSSVQDMEQMFYDCHNLTSLDVSGFDTSSVRNMRAMFYRCNNLISLDVSGFDTGSVENTELMFFYCSNLTSLDVSHFDTANVTSMYGMFHICSNLISLDVSHFNTSNVTDMYSMFAHCNSLESLDVSGFDTRKVRNMAYMFYYCSNLTNLDVSHFNTANVIDMNGMFGSCYSLESLDVTGFDTGSVQDMGHMFQDCLNLTSLDLSSFDTSNVTDMNFMFHGCNNLESLDVSRFDTSSVQAMDCMFCACESLTELNVSGFDTANVVDMNSMFSCCTHLTSLDVSNFNTSNVTDMAYMFDRCYVLHDIDLSRWDTSHVTDMTGMFHCAHSINTDFTISGPIDQYNNCFYWAACEEGCKVNVYYAGGCSGELAYAILNTKLDCDHVYLMGFAHEHQWDEFLTSARFVTGEDGKIYNEITYTCTICGDTKLERTEVVGVNGSIQSGETVEISIDEEYQKAYLAFTPKDTDVYSFYSTGHRDTYACLYDSLNNEIAHDDERGDINNFKIDYVLEAGITYLFEMCLLSDSDVGAVGSFNVTLETLHDWGEGEVVQEATDDEEVTIRYTCTYCGTTKEETCSKISHSGIDGNISWSIDYRGHLVIEGTGDYSYGDEGPAWCEYKSEIVTAEVNVSDITDTTLMFGGCRNLISVDLSRLDTSKVQSMNSMFSYCTKLTSLDVSGFDTSNVTDMSNMFTNCGNLSTQITISNGDVNFSEMFTDAATADNALIEVRYAGTCSRERAQEIVDTKSENSNVQLVDEEDPVEEEIVIVTQPEDYCGYVGDVATFSVMAAGEDLSYQWYYSTDKGATWAKSSSHGNKTDTLEIEFKAYRAGQLFKCEITDRYGKKSVTNTAELKLLDVEITITKQPEDYVGAVLDVPEFVVEAEGNGLNYQWYVSSDGGETWAKSYTPGYNTNTLNPVLREYRDGYQYYCEVTDALGHTVNSDSATMTIEASEVTITKQPEDVVGAYQELYQFSVEAEGVNLKYQWYVSQDGGETWSKSELEGFNTDTMNVRMYSYRDGYMYRCEITSGLKTVVTTREATLRLKESTVMLISSPKSVNCVVDSTVQFHVEATGENLKYQWYVSQDNGANWSITELEGAKTDTLTVKALKYRSGNKYRCIIRDESGKSVVSGDATLIANNPSISITGQPKDATADVNEDVQFVVEATGEGLVYQWYVSQNKGETWSKTGLTGNTTDTLTVTAYAYRDGNMYRCEIADNSGTKEVSKGATLSVIR